MTTPPHIEKAAREIIRLSGFDDATIDALQRADFSLIWHQAIKQAQAVWNLALEEAAEAGGTATRNAFAEASDNLTDQEFDELVAKVPAAIRALSVEG